MNVARRTFATALALAVTACSPQSRPRTFAIVGSPAPGFALPDQHGATFSLGQNRGNVAVVFFGYTHCEDVCPATLAHLHGAIEALPASERERVKVAFVTVDPARDDAASLATYVAHFDARFYGLSGTLEQLRPVYSAYHVFRQRVPRNFGKPYLVAHEGAIFIVDRDGILRFERDWRDSPAVLANVLRSIV